MPVLKPNGLGGGAFGCPSQFCSGQQSIVESINRYLGLGSSDFALADYTDYLATGPFLCCVCLVLWTLIILINY